MQPQPSFEVEEFCTLLQVKASYKLSEDFKKGPAKPKKAKKPTAAKPKKVCRPYSVL